VETQTELQNFLDQGRQELAQGHGRGAAIAYAHGAQIEGGNPQVHIGLAEANLALGHYDVVRMACKKVQELQPEGGVEGWTAQALLDLLDRRYERALESADKAIEVDPSIGYTHALRAHLLRILGQNYDANLARARATRLSYGGRFENCFPTVEPVRPNGYQAVNSASPTPGIQATPPAQPTQPAGEQAQSGRNGQIAQEGWSPPNAMQRRIIRTRFTLSQYPSLITNILIAINVIVYLLATIYPSIYLLGKQDNLLVAQGQYYRILTAMFLHDGIMHIALNMLSLFFVGRAVEIFFGKWRYLAIYFISGIAGGLLFLFLDSSLLQAAVGASGAIFGVFGAMGIFYIVNRRALGAAGTSVITQWVFILVLNLAIGFAPSSGIAIWDHIGGLGAGLLIGYILMPRSRRKSRYI
jgi:membrane associated rhomboid family serine protease